MKKIFLAVMAFATLALAGCNGTNEPTGDNVLHFRGTSNIYEFECNHDLYITLHEAENKADVKWSQIRFAENEQPVDLYAYGLELMIERDGAGNKVYYNVQGDVPLKLANGTEHPYSPINFFWFYDAVPENNPDNVANADYHFMGAGGDLAGFFTGTLVK